MGRHIIKWPQQKALGLYILKEQILNIKKMENKINIAELLKDCPRGMELDCLLCNSPIALEGVAVNESKYPIKAVCKDGFIHVLTKYGTLYNHDDAKCVIFPKGKTTWEGFVPPCQFKDGDIVATGNGLFIGIVEVKNNIQVKAYCAISPSGSLSINIAYRFERFATEEEKQKLFDAIKSRGYCWNAETKTLEKLIKVQPYKEETMKNKPNLLQQLRDYFDNTPREVVEKEWHDYDKYNEIAPTVNEYLEYVNKIRQPQYPKTYEECCEVLGIRSDWHLTLELDTPATHDLSVTKEFDYVVNLESLRKLIICCDAYWKIAGDQMGLGKPWKPNWTNPSERKYCIVNTEGNITKWVQKTTNKIFAFPTEEMRDAFKENFDGDIDLCKEFL